MKSRLSFDCSFDGLYHIFLRSCLDIRTGRSTDINLFSATVETHGWCLLESGLYRLPSSLDSHVDIHGDSVVTYLNLMEPVDGFAFLAFPDNFDIETLLRSLPQHNESTLHPPPPPAGVEPMPSDLESSPKQPFFDNWVAPNNQIWVFGHLWLHALKDTDEMRELEESEDGDEKKTWCLCHRGSIQGWSGSIQCEDPECATVWFHWECLSDLERQLACEYSCRPVPGCPISYGVRLCRYRCVKLTIIVTRDNWACIGCLCYRAIQCLTTYPYTRHWPQGVSGLEQLPEANRCLLVARLNNHFEVIFNILDSEDHFVHPHSRFEDQKIMRHARRETEHLRHGLTEAAIANLGGAPDPTIYLRRPRPRQLSWPVNNESDLQRSAKFWTTPFATASTRQFHTFTQYTLSYKHGITTSLPSSPAFDILVEGNPVPITTIPVDTLGSFSRMVARLLEVRDSEALDGSALCIPHVRASVAKGCIEYLSGGALEIILPHVVTAGAIAWLLEHTHFAHVLSCQPLMTALMVIMRQSPGFFSDVATNKRLFVGGCWEGNPAMALLMDPGNPIMVGDVDGKILCEKMYVRTLCRVEVARVGRLWEKKEFKIVSKKKRMLASQAGGKAD